MVLQLTAAGRGGTLCLSILMKHHRITERPESEGTHRDDRVQLLMAQPWLGGLWEGTCSSNPPYRGSWGNRERFHQGISCLHPNCLHPNVVALHPSLPSSPSLTPKAEILSNTGPSPHAGTPASPHLPSPEERTRWQGSPWGCVEPASLPAESRGSRFGGALGAASEAGTGISKSGGCLRGH